MSKVTTAPPRADYARLKALFNAVCDAQAGTEPRALLQALGAGEATVHQVVGLLQQDGAVTAIAAPVAGMATQVLGSSLGPGDRCGAWTLQRELGRGGMGRVFLAARSDGHYEQHAALKLLLGWQSPQALSRLAHERQILATLNHPNIARLLDGGATPDGQPYLVMEFADGVPLDRYCNDTGASLTQRLALVAQVCDAVAYAHARLVIHCDIKPANILVDAEGRVKLLDFGIARLEDQREDAAWPLAMTPQYASPEQREGQPAGVATDVYSLGRVLDELTQPVRPQGIRGRELRAIVQRATAPSAEQRYLSVAALAAELDRYRQHRPVHAVGRRPTYLLRKLWRRRWPILSAATAGVLALGVGLGVALWQRQQAERAARESAEVTRYLSDMLASASPDNHGGQSPTVLALLERSRADLEQRLASEPDTLWRLRDVMARTYSQLNRPDVALPMAEQQVALAVQRYGEADPRTLEAHIQLAHVRVQLLAFDKALQLLEPRRAAVARAFGDASQQHHKLTTILAYGYGRLGRLDEADAMMAEAGRLADALYPPGSVERVMHLNALQVLRVQQGRLKEAHALLKQAQAQWAGLPPTAVRSVFGMRRNLLAVSIRMGEYDGMEAQGEALVADMNRVMGPGNNTAEGLHAELARAFVETGQFAKALRQRDAALDAAQRAGVRHPAVLLPVRAMRLPAAALAQAAPREQLLQEAHALLTEMDAAREQVGSRRADAWQELARLGLMLEDAALADAALQRLRREPGVVQPSNRQLAARVDQLEGQLARLRRDLPASIERLQRHLGYHDGLPEPVSPRGWSAALDLAYSQALHGDLASAARTLARADQLRPRGMPQGVPLDAVQAYLTAWVQHGSAMAPGTSEAGQALQRRMGRPLARGAPSASLGGAFF